MSVTKMSNVSPLTNPNLKTSPVLKPISGRAKTQKPLTERSYETLMNRVKKANKKSMGLGFLLDRAAIPRIIAHKIANLTESYNYEMWELLSAADAINSDEDEPFGPAIEGVIEGSHATAERFQEAFDGIQACFHELDSWSRMVLEKADQAISSMGETLKFKQMIRQDFTHRYHLQDDGSCSLVLLPLMKGMSVYKNREKTLSYLLNYGTQKNNSSERTSSWTTQANTQIDMVCQVQPQYKNQVFSDHAGFVAQLSPKNSPPLYVYYQSLEHGQVFTDKRTANNFGSRPRRGVNLPNSGNSNSSDFRTIPVHDPQAAFLPMIQDQLFSLLAKADHDQASVLVIVGECNEWIDKGFRDSYADSYTSLGNSEFYFGLTYVNASKPTYKSGKLSNPLGDGRHALTGYLFVNHLSPPVCTLEASLVKLNDGTRQNILTVKMKNSELHAFGHLLNGKEDALARELKKCGYTSVGGDLNNISTGNSIVATSSPSHISIGSNSVEDTMFDKIVIL